MTRAIWDKLLDTARAAHAANPALAGFCPFPTDIAESAADPHHIAAADLMQADAGLARATDPLARTFLAGSPQAHWRETYKGTDIGEDFMARFGCYCLIGPNAPFASRQMHAFVVYMPPRLHYPWHHHPGEELYLILHGSAAFHRKGAAPETLGPGDVSQHAVNQPHATTTHDSSMMAYVIWRSDLGIAPVLTPPEALA